MSEIIEHNIICQECKHKNDFKVEGEYLYSISGDRISILHPEEAKKKRICEICGVILP